MSIIATSKILLTSAGFESDKVKSTFLKFLGKVPQDAKALFIPTAANNAGAIVVLSKCMNDLLKVGIAEENIRVFDLHCALSFDELSVFDAVYFTGGSPQYLMERINNTGFNSHLNKFVNNGGIYVGLVQAVMLPQVICPIVWGF